MKINAHFALYVSMVLCTMATTQVSAIFGKEEALSDNYDWKELPAGKLPVIVVSHVRRCICCTIESMALAASQMS